MTVAARRGSGAFTLVELLVTTSLMALVGGATVAALAGGLRVWEFTSRVGTSQPAALVAFDRMRRDVQNVRRFRPIPFTGSHEQCAFAAVERASPDAETPKELGRLGYFLDPRNHRLCRSFVPYRVMGRERLTDRCHAVLEEATRVRFSYFGSGDGSGHVGWSGSWEGHEPPLAVKCEVTVHERGREAITHTFLTTLVAASVLKQQAGDER